MYSSAANHYQKDSYPPPLSSDQPFDHSSATGIPVSSANYYPSAPQPLHIQSQPRVPWLPDLLVPMHHFRENYRDTCGTGGALYTLIGLVTGCPCLYSCFYRTKLRGQYLLHEDPCIDCLVHCCCEYCALCQEYRELKNRGFDMKIACGTGGALYTLMMLVTGCPCLYSCFYRTKLRGQFLLHGNKCTDCLIHCCCERCAVCQEYRELKNQGFDMEIGWNANVKRQTPGITNLPPSVTEGMSRCLTFWCPCITFGRIAEIVDKGNNSCPTCCVSYVLLGMLTGLQLQWLLSCGYRSRLRDQYQLPEEPCCDCLVHFFCGNLALCQEYRELKNRGFDMRAGWHNQVEMQTRGATTAPAVTTGMSR
ncbi:protein PLANT CADMIUM RESISTANCE 2-like protein [Cinnamomum micranthum f. kanehirae]|uniref:Protein PLANT CADMIUM RESISTANCE 2-like protein n=1 Tax=Cinnamomum micranthum f. kanehirae TaxID=337451 RepID=A0A3S3P8E2_9MAGN|nr:protein PLANT CADMIUM RESISTANCE 2-like protein [Cinnamomum micranthum f. kanehirae]